MLASHVDRLHLRVAFDLVGRAVAQHATVVHHGDAFDDLQRDVEVVFAVDVLRLEKLVVERLTAANP